MREQKKHKRHSLGTSKKKEEKSTNKTKMLDMKNCWREYKSKHETTFYVDVAAFSSCQDCIFKNPL